MANSVEPASSLTAETALQQLLDGNQRYLSNLAKHPRQDSARRIEVSKGQHPIAAILTCSDSRVAPEVVFDQGLGDLFVIRNAGNVLDDHVIGSIEYAVEHLHVPVVIVMGHQSCGAVTAAVKGGKLPGHLHSLIDSILPALQDCKDKPGDEVTNAVDANAERVAGVLTKVQPILDHAVQEGKVTVVGGRYDLDTGRFQILSKDNVRGTSTGKNTP